MSLDTIANMVSCDGGDEAAADGGDSPGMARTKRFIQHLGTRDDRL